MNTVLNWTTFAQISMVIVALSATTCVISQTNLESQQDKLVDEAETLNAPEKSNAEFRKEIDELNRVLAKIESERDAYDIGIAEVNLEIANRLGNLGSHVDAAEAYRKALHITRINEGLDSSVQIPILEQLNETYKIIGDTSKVSAGLDRLGSIYKANHAETSPILLPHLINKGTWHFSTYYNATSPVPIQHLVEAHEAFEQAKNIRSINSLGYEKDIYSALLLVNYHLQVQFLKTSEFGSLSGSRFDRTQSDSFVLNSYRRGKRMLIDGLHQAEKSEDPSHIIEAKLLLADWEHLSQKRHAAKIIYSEAYALASKLESEHPIRQQFNRAIELPVIDDQIRDHLQSEKSDYTTVALNFDISTSGIPINIKIQNTDNDNVSTVVRRRALRIMRSAVFRPALPEGQPISSTDVSRILLVAN